MMAGRGASESLQLCAADMYRKVLLEMPDVLTKRGLPLGWISSLHTPSLILYFVSLIRRTSELRHVDLSECGTFASPELAWIAENIRGMDSINLSNCVDITTKDASLLAKRCKFLTRVYFRGCANVDDKVAQALGDNCEGLSSVSFEKCSRITDIGVAHLVSRCRGIKCLDLSYEQVTDISVRKVGEELRSIQELSLTWCVQITDQGLKMLAANANVKTLKSLNLSACRRITDAGVLAVAQALVKLKYLNLFYCNKITDLGGVAVTHNLWDLEYLNFSDLYQLTDKTFSLTRRETAGRW